MLFPFECVNNAQANEVLSNVPSGLTEEQLQSIRLRGDELEKTGVKLYGGTTEEMVKAAGSHFPLDDTTRWLYQHMAERFQQHNEWNYVLTGFAENFYYLTYRQDDHFGCHIDSGPHTQAPRKLSGVLHLSDPSEYEGGVLEVQWGQRTFKAQAQKGVVTLFPSYLNHRVTPVTAGERRVLTLFAAGPNLR